MRDTGYPVLCVQRESHNHLTTQFTYSLPASIRMSLQKKEEVGKKVDNVSHCMYVRNTKAASTVSHESRDVKQSQ